MKKILKNHMGALFAAFAILFSAVVIAYFAWGIGFLVAAQNQAGSGESRAAQVPEFDLKGAASLDYRGTSAPATQVVPAGAASSGPATAAPADRTQ